MPNTYLNLDYCLLMLKYRVLSLPREVIDLTAREEMNDSDRTDPDFSTIINGKWKDSLYTLLSLTERRE